MSVGRARWFALGCLGLAVVLAGAAAGQAARGPRAVLPAGLFEFPPVVEGLPVKHTFTLANAGDEPLEILKIESG